MLSPLEIVLKRVLEPIVKIDAGALTLGNLITYPKKNTQVLHA